jgi:hypothetical protein
MSITHQLTQAKTDERKVQWARYRELVGHWELDQSELDELRSLMSALHKSEADVGNDARIIIQVVILRESVADTTCIDRSHKASVELEKAAKRRQEEFAAANDRYRLAKIEEFAAGEAVAARSRDGQELRRLTMENPELFTAE